MTPARLGMYMSVYNYMELYTHIAKPDIKGILFGYMLCFQQCYLLDTSEIDNHTIVLHANFELTNKFYSSAIELLVD